jgi:hypothetical protein
MAGYGSRTLLHCAVCLGLALAHPGASEAQLWLNQGAAATTALTVDAGDAIVAGGLGGAATVVRVAGATGQTIWQRNITGTASGGFFRAIARDVAGAAIVTGALQNTGTDLDVVVAKLAGNDGTVVWQHDFISPSTQIGAAVAADAAGDVAIAANVPGGPFAAIKLSGVDGTELWRYTSPGFRSTDVAFDAALATPVARSQPTKPRRGFSLRYRWGAGYFVAQRDGFSAPSVGGAGP